MRFPTQLICGFGLMLLGFGLIVAQQSKKNRWVLAATTKIEKVYFDSNTFERKGFLV